MIACLQRVEFCMFCQILGNIKSSSTRKVSVLTSTTHNSKFILPAATASQRAVIEQAATV